MAKPKIFGIITLVVLLCSGYVALKNKQAYEAEIMFTATAKEDKEKSNQLLIEAQDAVNLTISLAEEVESDVVKYSDEEKELKKRNLALKTELEEKTGMVADYQGSPEQIREQSEKMEKMRTTVTKMVKLGDEIRELDEAIAVNQGKLDVVAAQNEEVGKDLAALQEQVDARINGRSLESFRSSIGSVYPAWGFVTLNGGDADGIVVNSTLDVLRAGKVVAKLLVSAVEKDASSANIVPDSLAPGVVLMTGDEVVPAKRGEATEN